MEMSLLLIQTISQMFIMMFFGYILVKSKLLKTEDSKVLSLVLLYAVCPCTIIKAFLIDATPEKMQGLLFSFGGSFAIIVVFMLLTKILGKIFGLTQIEKASIIYSNCGNIVIPIVVSVLGSEWVFYTSGFIVIQTILLWTHGKRLVCNEKGFDLKKIFGNVNIIAIIIGMIMFAFNLRLPTIVMSTFESVGSMMGPMGMITIGMLIGDMHLPDIFKDKRTYLIAFLRLVVAPLVIVVAFKLLNVTSWSADAPTIFMVLLLQASAPVAQTVTQFAQLYNKHPGYASIMNVMTVIFSILTMPLMIMLYQMF